MWSSSQTWLCDVWQRWEVTKMGGVKRSKTTLVLLRLLPDLERLQAEVEPRPTMMGLSSGMAPAQKI